MAPAPVAVADADVAAPPPPPAATSAEIDMTATPDDSVAMTEAETGGDAAAGGAAGAGAGPGAGAAVAASGLADADEAGGDRRKSRRLVRKPELYSSQSFEPARRARSTKRKRSTGGSRVVDGQSEADSNATDGGDDDDPNEEESSSDTPSDSDQDVPDPEELRASKKKSKAKSTRPRQSQSRTSSQHAAHAPPQKRTKTAASAAAAGTPAAAANRNRNRNSNGSGSGTAASQLAYRPAAGASGKPRRKRVRPSGFANEEGLYAEVFGQATNPDAVAANWLTAYEQHNVNALTSFVNFILRCSGTTLTVTPDDISDVDNAANRLSDLQEEYQAQGIVDYPLISRDRRYRNFKDSLAEFIESFVRTLHGAGVLYSDEVLVENILVWITSMSSAAIRPFRHTTTVVSLAMVSALCRIAREVMNLIAISRKRLDTETRKQAKTKQPSAAQKGRLAALQASVDEGTARLETVNRHIADCIDTVFVHRYRDVDPRIRAECIAKLGEWIGLYREHFFDSNYLRYMGWVLSDVAGATRLVVLRQLKTIFAHRDNLPGLRVFTEKFRPRIVEMALRDAETDVRACAVELLSLIRDAGFLEPDDVDAVGRLVFDAEARVRKAAGRFFVDNIRDVCDAVREDVSDAALAETLMDDDDGDVDDFSTPRRGWIAFRCLADTLQAYDSSGSSSSSESARSDDSDRIAAIAAAAAAVTGNAAGKSTTRYALAAETIYPHMSELHHWESLAGYLLYDHSQLQAGASGETDQPATAVKQLFRLGDGQEVLLLDILHSAVRLYVAEVSKPIGAGGGSGDNVSTGSAGGARKPKKPRSVLLQEQAEHRSDTAVHLAQLIPQLLSKYGSAPECAAPILRLVRLLDYSALDDLQSSALVVKDVLGAVSKQFMRHGDQAVLAEAAAALIHARQGSVVRGGSINGTAVGGADELVEAVDGVTADLWKTATQALMTLTRPDDGEGTEPGHDEQAEPAATAAQSSNARLPARYSVDVLRPLCDALARIQSLSSITTSVAVLDGTLTGGRRRSTEEATPLDRIMRLAERGFRLDELHTGSAASQGHSLDKQLVHRSYGVLLMYFLWKIQQLRSQLRANDKNFSTDDLERTRASRDRFAAILRDAMSVRSGTDTVRFAALCTLLDLYVAFGTLRNAGPDDRPISDVTGLSDETRRLLASLVQEIDESTAHAVARIHDAYERRYARKAKKQLEPAPPSAAASLQQGRRRQQDDDDLDPAAPVRDDSDDDDEDANVGAASDAGSADGSESDDGNATTRTPTGAAAFAARLRAELAAEQQLCELTAKIVLALIGRVVDTDEGSVAQPETTGATVTNDAAGMLREKITRNRTRLGASYKEVVSYLDPAKAAGATQARKTKGKRPGQQQPAQQPQQQQQQRLALGAVLEEAEEQSDIAHNGELRHDPIEEEPEQPHLELDVDVGVEQDDAVLHGQVDVDSIMDDDADEIDAADGAQANADEIEV